MNLFSCDRCGIVLDRDKIKTPNIYLENADDEAHYQIDTEKAVWDGDTYIPAIPCPVCAAKIPLK